MKKLLLILIFLLTLNALYSQSESEGYIQYQVSNHLRTLEAVTEWNNEYTGKSTLTVRCEYNEQGQILSIKKKKINYALDQVVLNDLTVFEYDAQSNLIKVTEKDKNDKVLSIISYEYNGTQLTKKSFRSVAEKSDTVTTYFPDGQVSSYQVIFIPGNVTTYFMTNVIGPEGRIKHSVSLSYSTTNSQSEYFYSGEGLLLSVLSTDPGGRMISEMTYDYTPAGKVKSMIIQTIYAEEPSIVTMQYDEKDRLIQEENFMTITLYTYNNQGILIRKEVRKKDGSPDTETIFNPKGDYQEIRTFTPKSVTKFNRDFY